MISIINRAARLATLYAILWTCPAVASTLPAGPERNWNELERILSHKKLPPTWHDMEGNSIVYYHLLYGSEVDAISYLRKAKAAGVKLPDAIPLFNYAIDNNMQRVVHSMLNFGMNPNGTQSVTPLMRAAAKGHLEIMRMLLRAGALASKRNADNDDAVSYALLNGKFLAIKLLQSKGINIADYVKKSRRELLFDAIDGGSLDAISLLVAAGASPMQSGREGESVLTYALTKRASDAMIIHLLHHGADPCAPNSDAYSAKKLVMEMNSRADGPDRRYGRIFAFECN